MNEAQIEKPPARRKPKWFLLTLVPCLGFYIFAATFFNFFSVLLVPDFAEAGTIDVDGLTPSDWNAVAVSLVQLGNDPYILDASAARSDKSFHWCSYRRWFKAMRLHASKDVLNRIASVRVQIGQTVKKFDQNEIKNWKVLAPEPWLIPDAPGPVVSLEIPWKAESPALNAPPANDFVLHAAIPGLTIAIVVTALLWSVWWIGERPQFQQFLETLLNGPQRQETSRSPLAFILGFAFVVLALFSYYPGEGYPFTKDDNFAQFLPVIIRSSETLFAGHVPVWNPYQLLGAPTMTVGTYALTYPPTYIAYWIAHTVLHNDYATIEVFNLVHLILGYVACYLALRAFKVTAVVAASGAACWILSGWFLLGGRAQFNYTPLALYLPLLVLAVNRFAAGPVGWRWCIATGLAIGLLFHAGHAEFWVYSVAFPGLGALLLLINRTVPWRRTLWGLSALFIGLSVAAPLLVLQKLETDGINRIGGYGYSVPTFALILPVSSLKLIGLPTGKLDYQYDPQIYYAGTIFTACAALALLFWVTNAIVRPGHPRRDLIAANVWLLCGGLAFVLALAAPGVLWPVLSWLPIFDKFRWPVKYTPIIHMLFIFGGAAVLERILPQTKRANLLLATTVVLLLTLHVSLCKSAFFDKSGFCDFPDRPYPPLATTTQECFGKPNSARVLPVVQWQSQTDGFVQTLQSNFPSQYKLLSYDGYDTFISSKPLYLEQLHRLFRDPVNTAKALGIGWVAWAKLTDCPVFRGDPALMNFTLELPQPIMCKIGWSLFGSAKPVSVSNDLKIFKIADPDPIAFCSGHPDRPLPYTLDQAGVTVNTANVEPGTAITVNFLCWPWITASANGKQVAVTRDNWDRIQVTLPAQANEIFIHYSPPWTKSFLAAFACLLLAIIFGALAQRMDKTSKPEAV